MMVTVMRGPPQRALLSGGRPQPGKHKLEDAAGFIAPVRKVAMITGCDAEHAYDVKGYACEERDRAHS